MNAIHIEAIDCRVKFLENGKLWIHAIDESGIVGMLSLEVLGGEWAWINDLFVVESKRRMGAADFMVDYAERFAQSWQHVLGVAAGVSRENMPSRNLFKKRGYRHGYTYPESRVLLLSKSFDGREADAT